jgi:hypothetical protein
MTHDRHEVPRDETHFLDFIHDLDSPMGTADWMGVGG